MDGERALTLARGVAGIGLGAAIVVARVIVPDEPLDPTTAAVALALFFGGVGSIVDVIRGGKP